MSAVDLEVTILSYSQERFLTAGACKQTRQGLFLTVSASGHLAATWEPLEQHDEQTVELVGPKINSVRKEMGLI